MSKYDNKLFVEIKMFIIGGEIYEDEEIIIEEINDIEEDDNYECENIIDDDYHELSIIFNDYYDISTTCY